MIIDSSAVMALVRKEPEGPACFRALRDSPINRISAGTLLEASLVIDGLNSIAAVQEFEDILAGFEIIVEPATIHQVRIARDAYRRFGRGRGHPAKLNFGDCFSYALAKKSTNPCSTLARISCTPML